MNRHLPPFLLQLLGIAICIASVVYYFATLNVSLYITGLGFSLATLGTVQRLFSAVYDEVAGNATDWEKPSEHSRYSLPQQEVLPEGDDGSWDGGELP
jgi:hypothetical protein